MTVYSWQTWTPAYETLDPLIKEMAEPLKELMAAFSEVSRSNDYAANQYQKAKELHAVIYPAADEFEPMGYEFIHAVARWLMRGCSGRRGDEG